MRAEMMLCRYQAALNVVCRASTPVVQREASLKVQPPPVQSAVHDDVPHSNGYGL